MKIERQADTDGMAKFVVTLSTGKELISLIDLKLIQVARNPDALILNEILMTIRSDDVD